MVDECKIQYMFTHEEFHLVQILLNASNNEGHILFDRNKSLVLLLPASNMYMTAFLSAMSFPIFRNVYLHSVTSIIVHGSVVCLLFRLSPCRRIHLFFTGSQKHNDSDNQKKKQFCIFYLIIGRDYNEVFTLQNIQ